MKKGFQKIRNAAENFSRSKPDTKNNDDSLQKVEAQVDKYKDVLERLTKRLSPSPALAISSSTNHNPDDQREKKCKKVTEYKIGQAMEESSKELHPGPLRDILENCARLEKNIAKEIVNNEVNVESEVTKNLSSIMETNILTIAKQKRIVNKLMEELVKIKHGKPDPSNMAKEEELEVKLEKERDILAAEMYDLVIQEENISNYIVHFIKLQQLYYKNALEEIEGVMSSVNTSMRNHTWRAFKIPLEEHLSNNSRSISYVIELSVCFLMKRGLTEEGLLRVGCAGSKLRRLRSAIDAKIFHDVLPIEYQDVHVMAGLLKSYLRDLPEPLLTFRMYNNFVEAANKPTEIQRRTGILRTVNELPRDNYRNLRYLTKFLSILAQNQQLNKMSTQNIAIVMSPNLLWPQNQDDSDYAQKVSVTAASNTIVEYLISDWEFFFSGEVNFYDSLKEERLFQEISGFTFENEREIEMMSKSLNINAVSYNQSSTMMGGSTGSISLISGGNAGKISHSRSNSHDTSLILLGDQQNMKRSQSNSSLSDYSSPNQESPKPTMRRKHNKPAAPTPPDHHNRNEQFKCPQPQVPIAPPAPAPATVVAGPTVAKANLDEKFEAASKTSFISKLPPDRPPQPVVLKISESIENISRPDKPPRPVVANDTHNKMPKPKALPRNSIHSTKVDGGTELASPSEDEILIRDKPPVDERGEKPAIPERPATLMRPPSFRGPDSIHSSAPDVNNVTPERGEGESQNGNVGNGGSCGIKKAQSFRTAQSKLNNINHNNGSPTTLERTHMYKVDKQKVAFFQMPPPPPLDNQMKAPLATMDTQMDDDDPPPVPTAQSEVKLLAAAAAAPPPLTINTTITTNNDNVFTNIPPSPRGFDPKVKRPQEPAPPPPTNRKSSDGGSTNL